MKRIRSKFLITCDGSPIRNGSVTFDDDGRVVSVSESESVSAEKGEKDPDGLSPTRYGDWVKDGIAIDF